MIVVKRDTTEATQHSKSVFLSYSQSDLRFARYLKEGLRQAGINVVDSSSFSPGADLATSLTESIAASDHVVFIVPPQTKSSASLGEIAIALSRNKHVIPIVRDDADLPFILKNRQALHVNKDVYNTHTLRKVIDAMVAAENAPHDEGARLALNSDTLRVQQHTLNIEMAAHDSLKQSIDRKISVEIVLAYVTVTIVAVLMLILYIPIIFYIAGVSEVGGIARSYSLILSPLGVVVGYFVGHHNVAQSIGQTVERLLAQISMRRNR